MSSAEAEPLQRLVSGSRDVPWYSGGLLQSPRLLRDWHELREDDGRKITYSELFFDLIFVKALENLGEALRGEDAAEGAIPFGDWLLAFFSVYQAWSSMLIYSTRFFTDDLASKLLVSRLPPQRALRRAPPPRPPPLTRRR